MKSGKGEEVSNFGGTVAQMKYESTPPTKFRFEVFKNFRYYKRFETFVSRNKIFIGLTFVLFRTKIKIC